MDKLQSTYYLIRHKATSRFMPLMKRNRGYSHWNPSQEKEQINETKIPRFLISEKQARQVIDWWAHLPNARLSYHQSYNGDDNEFLDFKDDGRKKEDLEIIEVKINNG